MSSLVTSLSQLSSYSRRLDAHSELSFDYTDKDLMIELQAINEICKKFMNLNSKQKQHFLIRLLKMFVIFFLISNQINFFLLTSFFFLDALWIR